MPKFLVLYRSSLSARVQMAAVGQEGRQTSMNAWMDWAQRSGDAIVDFGAPLGDAQHVGASSASGGRVSGYSILEADSPDAVLDLLDDHPHLSGPGESSIDVLELLTPPSM